MSSVPSYSLSVADCPTVKVELFDDHLPPQDTKLEPKPRPPTTYLVWARQAANMVRAFTLAYGREYQECLSEFLNYLQGLHERDDHRFPFSFVADAWEEMFWRHTEEVRHSVAVLLKTLGK